MSPEEPHEVSVDTVYVAEDLGRRPHLDDCLGTSQDLDYFVTELLNHVLLHREAVVVDLAQKRTLLVVARFLA